MYKIETPNGDLIDPPKGRCWGASELVFKRYSSEVRVYFPKKGNRRPRIKT
jgi:adenine-specific DNA-methyltransferase